MGSIGNKDSLEFSLSESGLTRFPPNVEQISVEHEDYYSWLVVRRNETVLRFPLDISARRHLARLLTNIPNSSDFRAPHDSFPT
jgi:hypothetical protein